MKQQPSSSNPYAAILAKENVQTLAWSAGHADGLETDASGYIYIGSQGKYSMRDREICLLIICGPTEHNAIHRYNATTGIVEPFIRNPVIQVSMTTDGSVRCR